MRIQSDELKSAETKKQFNEAINRIMSISLVHQKLYQEKELANIKIKDYLKELFNDIAQYSQVNENIKLTIHSDLNRIGLKTVIPLGLLCNELYTNTFKHAFIDTKECMININIKQLNEQRFVFEYSDNGSWRSDKENGFGTELIHVLTQQLEGTFERKGSKYTFELCTLDN